eukprot:1159622-Pelagomonas_calceolata.AAC.10
MSDKVDPIRVGVKSQVTVISTRYTLEGFTAACNALMMQTRNEVRTTGMRGPRHACILDNFQPAELSPSWAGPLVMHVTAPSGVRVNSGMRVRANR